MGREPRRAWGLPEKDRKKVYLPRGIVIPWVWRKEGGAAFWKLNVRRLGRKKPKYMQVAGKDERRGWCTNALYGADKLSPGKAAIIVEGELDALTIEQEAGDIIAAVATGSTSAARKERWIRRLSACSLVLVAFDRDEAGRKAARFWGRPLRRPTSGGRF